MSENIPTKYLLREYENLISCKSFGTYNCCEMILMCEALARIMEPEISQAMDKAKREGRSEGCAEMIADMLVSGKKPEEIAEFAGISLEEV